MPQRVCLGTHLSLKKAWMVGDASTVLTSLNQCCVINYRVNEDSTNGIVASIIGIFDVFVEPIVWVLSVIAAPPELATV